MCTYARIMASPLLRTPSDVAEHLRAQRLSADLTQAELAELAGVSREWLVGLERGRRPRAELSKVLSLVEALDLALALEDRPIEHEPTAPAARVWDPRARRWAPRG